MASLIQPKKLISMKDKGTFQLFTQSTDSVKTYATGLSGVYDIRITDIKLIHAGGGNTEYAVQIISDTLRLSLGNVNDNIKFFHRNGANEIPNPIKLYQLNINNHVSCSFLQLGSVGTDINTGGDYNVVITFEYEKL
jgi:hypothetical protein